MNEPRTREPGQSVDALVAVAENGIELVERMVVAGEQMPIAPIRLWLEWARLVVGTHKAQAETFTKRDQDCRLLLREQGMCGFLTRAIDKDYSDACIRDIGHDAGIHEPVSPQGGTDE